MGILPSMKSAYEIAMEKLRKQDEERGEQESPLSPKQKEEIAEIRRTYKARLAEREILHESEMRKALEKGDPEAAATAEEGYRRDRVQIGAEMESKIRVVRNPAK